MVENLKRCPFCGQPDFDALGLREHFEKGHCEAICLATKENPGFLIRCHKSGICMYCECIHNREDGEVFVSPCLTDGREEESPVGGKDEHA